MSQQYIKQLTRFLDYSPTSFQAVEYISNRLKQHRFIEIHENEDWKLEIGKNYFYTKNNSAILAFRMGTDKISKYGLKIFGAHTDSPLMKVKPEGISYQAGIWRISTEYYGGPLFYTWVDRDLAIAGRIFYKKHGKLIEKNININQPIFLIPSLAIHLNRGVNKSLELNPQEHIQAIFELGNENKNYKNIYQVIEQYLPCKAEEVLDCDLFLYPLEKASIAGKNQDIIISGRIDNLAMCDAGINGLIEAKTSKATQMIALFDNEEIGSQTMVGADSNFLASALERIIKITEPSDNQAYFKAIASSFIISADGAHATHPNYIDKHDSSYRPQMGLGPVIKINAKMRYATNGYSCSMFEDICKSNNIPYQKVIMKADSPCGSTIGPITNALSGIPTIDVGNAMWAMHSIRESASATDHIYMILATKKFLESS